MFLMWIVPLLLVVLVVYAITRGNLFSVSKPVVTRVCSHCQQPAQPDWKVCPHCGQTL
jgi:predicted amidophosphoribosyltransferase